MRPLLEADESGIRCSCGGFWVDPWRPVETAIVTHAHADHARPGSGTYHAAGAGRTLLERRLAGERVVYHEYAEPFRVGDAVVSLHPAGHVLGSAQVRVEPAGGGPVWVAAGDYKRAPDPTCAPFEPIACDGFISEATFALPAYRWDPPARVFAEILDWWAANRERDRVSVLFSYALGKAQRVLAGLLQEVERRTWDLGEHTVLTHGATASLVEAYREAGVRMLPTRLVSDVPEERGGKAYRGSLVLAPPSAAGSSWMRRFGPASGVDTSFVSGWMRIRGVRRRRGYDRGFILSDHADWPDLVRTIDEVGARTVLVTHGSSETLSRFLRETRDIDARVLETAYAAEGDDAGAEA